MQGTTNASILSAKAAQISGSLVKMSQTSHFMLCSRCEGNIYYTHAVHHGANWYCKHCAGALKL